MTQTITRIVVGTDMSGRSDRAIERGFDLARQLSVPVFVVCILDDAMPEDLLAALHDKVEHQLQDFCGRLADGVPFTTTVQAGDPTAELLRAAHPAEGTLLVMGPHRPRPFLDGLRETTMQRVARRSEAAVLLVQQPVTESYGAVLSTCDYSPSSTAALQLGAILAPGAPITAVHAIHVPYSGMLETTGSVQMELQESFKQDALQTDKTWRAGTSLPDTLEPETVMKFSGPFSVIQDMTRGGKYDLITAGAHGRVGSARSLLGSFALDLMRDAPCDLLIARA